MLNPTLHPYTVPHPIHQWSTPIAPWKQVRPWWRLLNKWFIKGLCTAQWQWHRIFNTKSWFFSASGIFQWASRIKGYLRCSHLCEVGAQFYTNVFSWIQLIVFALGKPQATNITFFTCEPPVTQHSLAECDLGGDQGVQQVLIKTEDPNGADWGETGKKSFRSARAARSFKQNKLGKIKALPMNQFRKGFTWWWSKTWGARERLDILLPSPIKSCWNGPWYFNQTFKDILIRDAKAARMANLSVLF